MAPSIAHSIVLIAFVCCLILAAGRDFASFRIPNWISAAIVLLYPVHILLAPQPVDWIGGVVVGATVLLVGFLFFVLRVLGAGDAKLMAAVSMWGGFAYFGEFMLVTVLASVFVAIAIAVRTVLASTAGTELAHGASGERRGLGFLLSGLWHAPLTKLTIPYGVAIAAGGVYLAAKIVAAS